MTAFTPRSAISSSAAQTNSGDRQTTARSTPVTSFRRASAVEVVQLTGTILPWYPHRSRFDWITLAETLPPSKDPRTAMALGEKRA